MKIQEEYSHIVTCMIKAAHKALRRCDRKYYPYWWIIYLNWLSNKNDQTRNEYQSMDKEVKREVVKKEENELLD